MAKDFSWDSEQLIGEVMHGSTSKTTVSHVSKGEKNYVKVSKMYCTKADPVWKFKSGMTFEIGTTEGQRVFDLMATMFAAPNKVEVADPAEPKSTRGKKGGAAK